MRTKLNFLKTALKDYKVGAILPTSRFVIRRILKILPQNMRHVVEYGAGDGVITKELLKSNPNLRLKAIEINPFFVRCLREIKHPRLEVIEGDICKISSDFRSFGIYQADAVISGIPFSFLNSYWRRRITETTYDILTKEGYFLLYQTSPLMLKCLKEKFGPAKVEVYFEPLNLPPYFILVARK